MKPKTCLVAIGLAILFAGCTAKPEPKAEDNQSLLKSLRSADCSGNLTRDAPQIVSGISDCRNGTRVVFSGRSNVPLPPDLSCRYWLFYTDSSHGDGGIECSDGSRGEFVVEETDRINGTATARLKDGREITLTYTRTF